MNTTTAVLKKRSGSKANYSDIYAFDCLGLVVIKDVLPQDQVQRALELMTTVSARGNGYKIPFLHLDPVFWDILNDATLLSMAEALCGPRFRLDHAFAISSLGRNAGLHGGPCAGQGSCTYQSDGRVQVTRLSAGFALTAQSPSTGGLCYIPGSHKSNDYREGGQVLKEILGGKLNHPCICVPELHPGDLVLFSESLVHGDSGWNIAGTRRLNLYYMFCPGFMCWRDPREQERYAQYARSDIEKRLVEPPWVGQLSEDNGKQDLRQIRRKDTL